MTGKMYAQFISTFLMGMLSGAFLYVTVFAPAYKSDLGTSEADVNDGVVIEGMMHGVCTELNSCATFRLLENRRFDYLPYPDTEVEQGRLPSDITQTLFDALDTQTLENASLAYEYEACASDEGGLDFTYLIDTQDGSYTLDTCTTGLSENTELQQLFIDAWDFMQNPTTTYPQILEEGVGEYIINKTFERFHEGAPEQSAQ
jgi:hypothetical protein